MIRRPPRSTHCISSAASDVYKRQRLVSWWVAGTVMQKPDTANDRKIAGRTLFCIEPAAVSSCRIMFFSTRSGSRSYITVPLYRDCLGVGGCAAATLVPSPEVVHNVSKLVRRNAGVVVKRLLTRGTFRRPAICIFWANKNTYCVTIDGQ